MNERKMSEEVRTKLRKNRVRAKFANERAK
jgi:hypothetical protein